MKNRAIDYSEVVRMLYADCCTNFAPNGNSICRNVTLQITSSCNLQCTYCYEHHKCNEYMSLETAKGIVDSIFDMYERNDNDFINHKTRDHYHCAHTYQK